MKSCRTMRPRDAPSDRRMAISRRRTVARESIRPARFAAAVNSTRPKATISGVKARSTLNVSAIGVAAGSRMATVACVSRGWLAVVRCAQASTAARAEASVCVALRRPTTSSRCGCSGPKRLGPSSSVGSIVSGAQKSRGSRSRPTKPSGAMPTISK